MSIIRTGYPYRGNPLGLCAIGWATLDGRDPTKIVARATKPLIMATTRDWETCQPHRNETTCQVPMVVFANGLKPLDTTTEGIGTTRSNEFYVIFGGADSVVGGIQNQSGNSWE